MFVSEYKKEKERYYHAHRMTKTDKNITGKFANIIAKIMGKQMIRYNHLQNAKRF